MKRVLLVVLLFCSTMTLTSFGLIDNPKVAVQYQKSMSYNGNGKLLRVNLESKNIKPISENTDLEKEDSNSNKSLFRAFFSFVFQAISKVVIAFTSK